MVTVQANIRPSFRRRGNILLKQNYPEVSECTLSYILKCMKEQQKNEFILTGIREEHIKQHSWCLTHLKVDTSKNHVAIKGISFRIKQTGLKGRRRKTDTQTQKQQHFVISAFHMDATCTINNGCSTTGLRAGLEEHLYCNIYATACRDSSSFLTTGSGFLSGVSRKY